MSKLFERIGKTTLAIALALPTLSTGVTVFANDENTESQTDAGTETSASYPAAQDGYTYVSSVASVSQEANDVTLTLEVLKYVCTPRGNSVNSLWSGP